MQKRTGRWKGNRKGIDETSQYQFRRPAFWLLQLLNWFSSKIMSPNSDFCKSNSFNWKCSKKSFLTSGILVSFWNDFIKFLWHGQKFTKFISKIMSPNSDFCKSNNFNWKCSKKLFLTSGVLVSFWNDSIKFLWHGQMFTTGANHTG